MVGDEPYDWYSPGGLLADLWCEIMTDAEIGHFVKKIDLDVWNNCARKGWKPDAVFEKQLSTNRNQLPQSSKTNMEIIEEAVRAVGLIPTEEADDWLYRVRCGNEDLLIALLLLYAPKVHRLKFAVPSARSETSYLFKTIQHFGRQGCTANTYPSYLKNVELSFAELWESLDFVKAFMSLPSLQSIKTDYLFVSGQSHEPSSAILRQPSNAKDISFRNGGLPGEASSEIFRGVKNLRAFVYDFLPLWCDGNYTPTFDGFDVLCSLEANSTQCCHSIFKVLPAKEKFVHGPPTCVPAAKIASGMAPNESLPMLAVFKPKKKHKLLMYR